MGKAVEIMLCLKGYHLVNITKGILGSEIFYCNQAFKICRDLSGVRAPILALKFMALSLKNFVSALWIRYHLTAFHLLNPCRSSLSSKKNNVNKNVSVVKFSVVKFHFDYATTGNIGSQLLLASISSNVLPTSGSERTVNTYIGIAMFSHLPS